MNELILANEKLKLRLEDRDRTIGRLEKLEASAEEWRQVALQARFKRAQQLPHTTSAAFAIDDLDADEVLRRRRRRDLDLPANRLSLSPPSRRRNNHSNVSKTAAAFDSRSLIDGPDAAVYDRSAAAAGRPGSRSTGSRNVEVNLCGTGLQSLPPSQAAAISSVQGLDVDLPGTASTLSVIQAAMNRQRIQTTELNASLDAARDENASLRRHLDAAIAERCQSDKNVARLEEERDGA